MGKSSNALGPSANAAPDPLDLDGAERTRPLLAPLSEAHRTLLSLAESLLGAGYSLPRIEGFLQNVFPRPDPGRVASVMRWVRAMPGAENGEPERRRARAG